MLKIARATTVPSSLYSFCYGILKELGEKYEVIAISSPGKELDVLSQIENVRTVAVPMNRRISIMKDIISLIKLAKVLYIEKPIMIHSMTPKAGLLCMLAGRIVGIPIRVHTFTGLVFPSSSGLKRKLLMVTDSITCACATHIIPEGYGVKNDLISNKITKKPLKVLGYGNVKGVDMNFFSKRDVVVNKMTRLNIQNPSVFTFLFVGRIVKEKGIDEICIAFNKLSKSVPVRLLLVGPFENDIDPISDYANNIISTNEAIEYVGEKYGEDLLPYFLVSDCFVFPSYREGFPNVVLEAGAMGLPSIVTNINGSNEIINEGENGLIIPSRDSEALYNAMLKMIKETEYRQNMANNARNIIANRYEQSYVRKCLYDFYDEILKPYV